MNHLRLPSQQKLDLIYRLRRCSRLSWSIDGLHTAQNNEVKWHSAVRCHYVNTCCFVMCVWKIRQKMRITVLFVTNLVQFNLINEFQLIYKN